MSVPPTPVPAATPAPGPSSGTHAPVLVTGAGGYIGGLLVPVLLARGYRVRVLVRRASRVADRAWARDVDVVEGDAADPRALARALDGVGVAYYLLHSMAGGADFVARDRHLARTFARAAADAGTRRIVYLSGLHPGGVELSAHMGSRVEAGDIFLRGQVPALVLQAGIVLGDGSASFDMLRHLAERLPVMVAPQWLDNRIQPIGIDDVLHYLSAAAAVEGTVNRTVDIAGPDVMTYRRMLQRYALVTGLGHRRILALHVLTPRLASLWVGFVTPVAAGVARPLVGSLIHEAVAHDDDAATLLGPPPDGPTSFDDAVARATASLDPGRWRRTAWGVGAATVACAVAGSALTNPGSRWYRELDTPRWQPPPAAFPAIWTTLYAGIAVAATTTVAELEDRGRSDRARAFRWAYGVNLALNAGWNAVFFRAHAPRAAALWSGALALSSADLARRAAPLGRGRAAVLGVYTAWCGVATALSAVIARRNRRR